MPAEAKPRTIHRIELEDGYHTYALRLKRPRFAIYDVRTERELSPEEIVSRPILFIVSVFHEALKRWPVIDHQPPITEEIFLPPEFIQSTPDEIRVLYDDYHERPGSYEECLNLERVQVWSPDLVEERINDHYAGRPNRTLLTSGVRRPRMMQLKTWDDEKGDAKIGAWGVGIFDNAPAAKLVSDLLSKNDSELLLEALQAADRPLIDVLDASTAARGLAAAEIAVASFGPGYELPRALEHWFIDKEPSSTDAIGLALRVVYRVLRESELFDLWSDYPAKYPEWYRITSNLLSRLMKAAGVKPWDESDSFPTDEANKPVQGLLDDDAAGVLVADLLATEDFGKVLEALHAADIPVSEYLDNDLARAALAAAEVVAAKLGRRHRQLSEELGAWLQNQNPPSPEEVELAQRVAHRIMTSSETRELREETPEILEDWLSDVRSLLLRLS